MKLNALFENFSSQIHRIQNESSDDDSAISARETEKISQKQFNTDDILNALLKFLHDTNTYARSSHGFIDYIRYFNINNDLYTINYQNFKSTFTDYLSLNVIYGHTHFICAKLLYKNELKSYARLTDFKIPKQALIINLNNTHGEEIRQYKCLDSISKYYMGTMYDSYSKHSFLAYQVKTPVIKKLFELILQCDENVEFK